VSFTFSPARAADVLDTADPIFGAPLRNLTILDSRLTGRLPRSAFDVADVFVLKTSNFWRDSLNAIQPPPSRLPPVCQLPKFFFDCPLPT
jgi:hypothetical protein